MARIIDDALSEARILIQDDRAPYRVADAELVRYLNNGLAETRRLRPDIWVGRTGGMFQIPVYEETDLNTSEAFPISDMYFPAVVNYMVSMAEWRDDQSAETGRSIAYLQLFKDQLRAGI